jgi:hypothetical protein
MELLHEDDVPDLIVRPTSIKSSGTTTPTGGILLTSKHHYIQSRTSGSVTPNSEFNEQKDGESQSSPLISRKLGKKVRFNTIALSDEDEQISSVKRYKMLEAQNSSQKEKSTGSISEEAIITEPRRRRARIEDHNLYE